MAQPGSIGSQMPASEDTQLRKFADLERQFRELGPSIAKSFQGTVDTLNATVATQATQITELAATNATLTTQQATLTSQQAELTAQQAELTSQQAELEAQVAAQVSPAAGASSASGFAIDGTSTVNASVNLTVPAGFTRALVFASGTTTAANGSGASDYAFAKIIIAGVSGPESSTVVNDISSAAGAFMGNLTAAYTRSLTGLSGGSVSVQIATRTGGANFGTAGGLNRAQIAGQVVFLR